MTEHIFSLQNISPLEVYGVNDTRLRQIQSDFPEVRFVARGEDLKISGEEEKIEQLKAIIGALIEEVSRKGPLSENRFLEILQPDNRPAQQGDEKIGPDTVILHGSGGLLIKARNKGQRQIVASANKNDIVFAIGPAGTGKTYMAVALAVKALKEKQVKRIVLSRPAVDAGESLGFLPGDMKEKVDPYLRPLYDALGDMIHSEKLKYYLENNTIEIVPLAYMRGRTLNNAFVIVDEAQNATEMQFKMLLTRLGEYSRMIITGDDSQIDLPPKVRSGLKQALRILPEIDGIGLIRMHTADVIRHKLVKDIIKAYNKEDKRKTEKAEKAEKSEKK
ncbi:MAG: PhoH family protein [Bacteroidia bacterium]|nr:PhoH family protein [Bacteroidia bacterium]